MPTDQQIEAWAPSARALRLAREHSMHALCRMHEQAISNRRRAYSTRHQQRFDRKLRDIEAAIAEKAVPDASPITVRRSEVQRAG